MLEERRLSWLPSRERVRGVLLKGLGYLSLLGGVFIFGGLVVLAGRQFTVPRPSFSYNLAGFDGLCILVIALLIFGKRLPEVMRSLGKGIEEFKRGINDISGA
jgi:TatA/E family protein of Tat protein translocase